MSSSCHCCSFRSACSLSGTAADKSRAHSSTTDCCGDLDVPAACVPPVLATLARPHGLQILASTFPRAESSSERGDARTDRPDARSSRSLASRVVLWLTCRFLSLLDDDGCVSTRSFLPGTTSTPANRHKALAAWLTSRAQHRGRCAPVVIGDRLLACENASPAVPCRYRCCSIKRLPSACARFAASRSPSAACTIEPFIRMCQERAKVSGSRSPASSARLRTTERMFSR